MKKLISILAIAGLLTFGINESVFASVSQEVQTEQIDNSSDDGVHKQVKKKFIEGGAVFMSFVLLCLILGLAVAIERIIYLGLSSTNTNKLVNRIEKALSDDGIEAAKDVCRNTRGPVASIFYQGLDRYEEGIDMAEKSVISYGSVQAASLEKGLSWLGLFIALAPMLGFMGTVIGMIQAFDNIQVTGTITPASMAGGIKVALITTVSGLIVAIILQIFYNLIVSMIDTIINKMEDSSVTLLDILVKYKNR